METINGYHLTGTFPVIIKPAHPVCHVQDFIQSLHHNQQALHQLLLKHGALLFRDFPVSGACDFSGVIEALALGKPVNYIGGDSPRDKVSQKVYTSTEAPPALHIPLHQELSFVEKHPRHIYFYCDIPAQEGGATIIGDAKKIYQAMNPDVLRAFEAQGLTYTSRYYHKSKIMSWVNRVQRSHKSWIEVFETENKSEVEKQCHDQSFSWEWLSNDWLKIMQTRPAVLTHPLTKEKVWFNQAHLYDFNPRLLGMRNYLAAKLFYFRRSTRLHEIAYANGKKIPRPHLYHILDTLKAHTVATPWHKGDVMVLDNILAMHGRAPFKGKRRVLTALTI